LVAVGICLVIVIGFNALTEICTAVRQVRWVAMIQFTNSLLFAMLSAAILHITNTGALAVIMACGLACLVTGILAYRALSQSGYFRQGPAPHLPYRDYWQKTWTFAMGIWISNLATNLFNATDRFMIVHFAAPSPDVALTMVGQYHSSRILGELLMSVGLLASSILVPYLARDWERGRRRSIGCWINFSIKTVGITLVGASIVAMLLGPWLFQTFLAGKYAAGLRIMPMVLSACVVFSMTAILQTYLLCAERSRRIPMAYVLGIVVCVSLTAIVVPWYGLAGVVGASRGGPPGEELVDEFPGFCGMLRHKYDVRVLPNLLRLFEQRRIDAVITVGADDKMFWGRLTAWLAGVPVVMSALHSTGCPDGIG